HHPDLLLYGWNKLRVILSTHDRGGITELDITLAKKIEQLRFS
ncbi:MAG: 4a-hydroxytetrahydrobiopterin dehydratase, partial [Candidatus Kapabacteria bacterium]|nr:4a-hydroxytetrahydrobiopterin dehydratase [Candidatus Kapabacteria bacterium]MDW7997183.1 4a-hydroxytetrahydrobiopterin dehydratase [Bacteroidota bacterium]